MAVKLDLAYKFPKRKLWFHNPPDLPFDQSLQLLTPAPPVMDGRGVLNDWGIVVGQAYMVRKGKHDPEVGATVPVTETLQRSLLWRNCGMPLSLVGFSGTAIELAPQSGRVIGFQNYELWMNDPPPRGAYEEPVEGLYLREDIGLERIRLGNHSIYGALQLPAEFYQGGITIKTDIGDEVPVDDGRAGYGWDLLRMEERGAHGGGVGRAEGDRGKGSSVLLDLGGSDFLRQIWEKRG